MTDAELVRAAAERVMGWRVHFRNTAFWVKADEERGIMKTVEACVSKWNPLTSDADAFMLCDKMAELGYGWRLDFDGMDSASFVENPQRYSGNRDLREEYDSLHDRAAVCGFDRRKCIVLAALRAVGVEVRNG